MLSLRVFVVGAALTVALSATIQQKLKEGLCVCVADSDIYARDGPGEEHRVIGVLMAGDCFITHGGLLHIFGNTWYQVREVNHEERKFATVYAALRIDTNSSEAIAATFPVD
ncbi:hypothetical protein FSP39_021905 [Pinctada imbricata]|uniref:Uncharacterized protein n=1 Tax=Pinctada imbricata TaxID=66713 RepID=A0AA89C8G4_PINIB|nr:hypothetical protein FSP39_021905 [Pinctada imbricata]